MTTESLLWFEKGGCISLPMASVEGPVQHAGCVRAAGSVTQTVARLQLCSS